MDSTADRITREFVKSRCALLGYLRSLVRDPALAEDLLQDTWVVVMRRVDDFQEGRDFGAWVRGIARNLARNAVRSNAKFVPVPSEELFDVIADSFEPPRGSQETELEDRLRRLHECVGKIGREQARLLSLRYKDRLPIADVAERVRRTPAAIQVTLSRIRAWLLDCVMKKNATVEVLDAAC